jgi:hypothetical protein
VTLWTRVSEVISFVSPILEKMSLVMATEISRQYNILLVGQLYIDTILHVNDFPEQDSKIRANYAEQRTGGNTCNTAKVLGQYKQLNVCYMSAAGSRDTSRYCK